MTVPKGWVPPIPDARPNGMDPLLAPQTLVGSSGGINFDTPLVNVAGAGFTGVNPSDTNGDVGINHYIQTINNSTSSIVRIINKSDGSLNQSFTLSALAVGSNSNDFGYRNEELDAIGRQISETMDDEFQIQLEQRAQALIHRDQPTTLLLYPRIELLIHRRFRDATPGPLGLHFERFWVPRDEQRFRDE